METRQSSVAPACSVNFQEPATCAWAIFSVTFQGKLLISKNWIDLRKIPRWFIYNTILGSHTQKNSAMYQVVFPQFPVTRTTARTTSRRTTTIRGHLYSSAVFDVGAKSTVFTGCPQTREAAK